MDSHPQQVDASETGATVPAAAGGRAFDASDYVTLTRIIERLHRRFLDVLRSELARWDVVDLNAVQCLLLSNIGDEEINVRNLMDKGYYQGSNASYNIKKLVEAGYLEQHKSPHDRRATMLKASAKGLALCARVHELEGTIAERFADGGARIDDALDTLRSLERLWADIVRYGV